MAQGMPNENTEQKADRDMDSFIAEYNLQSIASELKRGGLSVADLCGKSAEEVDELARAITSNIEAQERFKTAVSESAAKSKGKMSEEKDEDEEEKESDQIYVKTLTGKTISMDFRSTMKVKELKERIEEQEGIAQKQQKLVFAGKQLDDDVSL